MLASAEQRLATLRATCAAHARVAIIGGPRTGKTTLAGMVEDRPVIHTDRFSHVEWTQVPKAIIDRCKPLDRFVLEGVQAARALRAGLVVDAVIYLDAPACDRTDAHVSMSRGIQTIFGEWRGRNRTVHVVSPDLAGASA